MPSNYDNAAWFYDHLSRVVFGSALIKAQTAFLHCIPAGSKVLVAGGGTGWIIEEIGKIHPYGLEITYVELSQKMMRIARKRNTAANKLIYINAPVEDADLVNDFDVVITPFLLDSIAAANFHNVFNCMDKLLKASWIWLNIDFQLTGKWWQPAVLKSMYLFFRLMGCVDTVQLPRIKQAFEDRIYQTVAEKTFFGDFVASTVYRKSS